MSYQTLSEKLKKLGERLEQHATELGGKTLAKAASTYEGQTERFAEKVDFAVKGLTPEIKEMEGLFSGPDKKYFSVSAVKMIYREAMGKPMSAGACKTAASAKNNLMKALKGGGDSRCAVEKARQILVKAKGPKGPIPKDEEKLRLELNRLGGLDDEQLIFELENRYSKVGDLKKLANANGISTPKGTKKAEILSAIISRSRRIHGHTFR